MSVDPNDSGKVTENWNFMDTWREMQKLLEGGRVRSIGVSNFQIAHLEKLLGDKGTTVVPAVNQIELHPHNPSPKLVAYNKSKGIHTTGYSNLGGTRGNLLADERLAEVVESSEKGKAQVLVKWGLQKGWSVIPKSSNEERVRANFEMDGWDLSEEEMAKLDGIEKRFKNCKDEWLPERVFFGDDE